MSPDATSWQGCHGVRLDESMLDFAPGSGAPIARVTVRVGDVAPSAGSRLWTQEGGGIARWLTREDEQRFVLEGTSGPRIAIDTQSATVTATADDSFLTRQLLAAFALPLMVHDAPVLLVHGAACARDGQAVVLVGPSGAGKSSALVALTNVGWEPISEDVCALDLRGDAPVVWPGPPWVRVLRGDPGPTGAPMVADGLEKTAWDIGGRQPRLATPLCRLFVLGGGASPAATNLDAGDVIGLLAPHAVWLVEADRRAAGLFPRVASVAGTVPATRVALARHAGWREDLLTLVRV